MIDSTQLRFLKSKAHHLKPVLWVGQKGLNKALLEELEILLETHELIKIKIMALRETRKTLILELCTHSNATLIHTIGQMCIIYRKSKKPKN